MIITTKRCTIRPFEEKDIDDFMIYRNDEDWMVYQGFKGLSKTEYSDSLVGDFLLDEGIQLAIIEKSTDSLIGDIFLKREENIFWIGYTVNPLKARKGFAFEALESLLNWVKNQGASGVNAGVTPENIPSIKLLEKLKFHYIFTDERGRYIYTFKF